MIICTAWGFQAVKIISFCTEGTSWFYFTTFYNKIECFVTIIFCFFVYTLKRLKFKYTISGCTIHLFKCHGSIQTHLLDVFFKRNYEN